MKPRELFTRIIHRKRFLRAALALVCIVATSNAFAVIQLGNPTTYTAESISAAAPQGLTYHPGRNSIFILDNIGKIIEIGLDGKVIQYFYLDLPATGGGIDYDPISGQLLVTNALKVFQVSVNGSSVTQLVDLDGDVFSSQGIAVHPQTGNLFIADDDNEEIVQVDRAGNFISSFSTRAISNSFIEPSGIAFLGSDLLIADDLEGSRSLYLVSTTGQLLQAIGSTTPFGVTDPEGVTAVGNSQIWICGDLDQKIVKLRRLDTINQPPVADAGPNRTVNEGVQVNLNGTGSSDPDGDVLSFTWSQTAGPPVQLIGANTATPQFTAPMVSTNTDLTFRLTVSDGIADDTDTVSITVQNVNQAPTARAGPDQSVNEGSVVSLDGTGSSDPEGTALTYSWIQTAGPGVQLGDPSIPIPSFTAPLVNALTTLSFQLTVSDGQLQASDSVNIEVRNVVQNQAPVVDAGPDQAAASGETVILTGAASDPNGDSLTFRWVQTGGPGVTLSGTTTLTATFVAPPVTTTTSLTFELRVSDSSITVTDSVTVVVSSALHTYYFAQIGDGQLGPPTNIRFQTSLILVSTGTPAWLQLEFFDTTGSPMALQLGDLGVASAFSLSLGGGQAVSLQTPGTGPIRVGYARLTADAEIGGTAVFTRSDLETGTILYEAGVGASQPVNTFSLFVDSTGARDTGLALLHPPAPSVTGNTSATVNLRLYDKAFQLVDEEVIRLSAGEHLARYIYQLFPNVAARVSEMEGVLAVSADRPLVAVTLRQNDDPQIEYPDEVPTLTTFPVIPAGGLAETHFFAQVGDGQLGAPLNIRFQTSFILASTGSPVTAQLDFFDPAGSPMKLQLGNLGTSSSFSINLGAGQAVSLQTAGTGPIQVGYARLTANSAIGGTAVFSRSDLATGALLYEAGVGTSQTQNSFSLFVDSIGNRNTGLALVHPPATGPGSGTTATVTLRLYDKSFQLLDEEVVLLPAGEHLARYIWELFPDVAVQAAEMEGVLTVSSDRPVAAVTLRQNDAEGIDYPDEVPTLTTFPVIPTGTGAALLAP